MKQNTQATINELLAGSVGGAAQVLVGQPLDTIKTRAQIAPSKWLCILHLPGFILTRTSEGMFVSHLGEFASYSFSRLFFRKALRIY